MVGIFSVVYSYVHALKNPSLLSQIPPFFHLKKRKNKTKIKKKSTYFVRRNL